MSEGQQDNPTIVGFDQWESHKAPNIPPIVPFSEWGKSKISDNELFEQAFVGYPDKTIADITRLMISCKTTWGRVNNGGASYVDKMLLDIGEVVLLPQRDRPFSKRELGLDEIPVFQKATDALNLYKLESTFGEGKLGVNSRFYLNVGDTAQSAEMIATLVERLHELKTGDNLSSWQIKSEGTDEHGIERFSPAYIDKGGVIVYTTDDTLPIIEGELLELQKSYPDAFFKANIPFKYVPPNTPNQAWTAAMERASTNPLDVMATPEQGMKAVMKKFLPSLGLNKQWIDPREIGADKIREEWEKACSLPYIRRSPQEPWLTTDRPRPAFFS
ncbi:hypothetical protein BH09PAT1_BH09PAT1_4210 [soil metagenome]